MLDKEELEITVNVRNMKAGLTIRYCLRNGQFRGYITPLKEDLFNLSNTFLIEIKEKISDTGVCKEKYFNFSSFQRYDQVESSKKIFAIIEGQESLTSFTMSFYEGLLEIIEPGVYCSVIFDGIYSRRNSICEIAVAQ